MKRILLALFALVIAIPANAFAIEVHGHRAARTSYPESSHAAWQFALDIGVDVIEGDLRVTRDGVVVLHHDETLSPERCLDGNGARLSKGIPVQSLTLSELRAYDCGSLGHPDFPRQARVPSRILTLEEALAHVARSEHPHARKVGFYLELKTSGSVPPARAFAAKVADAIAASGSRATFIVSSFRASYADAARDALHARGISLREKVVSPPMTGLTRASVRALQAAGNAVIPWTANEPDEWKRLIDMKVDGIITDDPAGLIEFLRARGE